MLTLSQKKTLNFIVEYINENGHSPTMAEIAAGIGITSRGVVHRYVTALANEGYLKILPGHRRNIVLAFSEKPRLPIKGRIAAGSPIEAIVDEEAFDIIYAFLGPKRYALKVKGDSMVEEGIHDGDIVVCEYNDHPADGEIVVALIDNQVATLKKVKYGENNVVTLIPANSALSPVNYSRDQITFQGIYIGLLRLR